VRKIKLKTQIKRPITDVFAFAINPKNTPKYVDSIAIEKTNEWPIRVGTLYTNQRKTGEWSEYTVTALEENKIFSLTKNENKYHLTYTFTSIDSDLTELEYEWVDNGELEARFIQELLDNLKRVMESE
jgi:hypothetical protein